MRRLNFDAQIWIGLTPALILLAFVALSIRDCSRKQRAPAPDAAPASAEQATQMRPLTSYPVTYFVI